MSNQRTAGNTNSNQGPVDSNQAEFPDLNSVTCRKNPRHTNFLAPSKLSTESLPEGFRGRHFADIINLKAEETVRIIVRYTSHDRPTELGSHEKKGTNIQRLGCGTVFVLFMARPQRCHNTSCTEKPRPHEVSGTFKVMTVAHIVFDDAEAKNTTIEFFFDDDKNTENVVKAQGIRLSSIDVANNRSIIECVTHDFGLHKKLQHFRSRKIKLQSQLPKTLTQTSDQGATPIGNLLVVLTSHPHGAAKRVSFGSIINIERKGDKIVKMDGITLLSCTMMYTAPSCVGSGGGSITVYNTLGHCVAFAPHFGVVERRSASALGWIDEHYFNTISSAV